MTLFTVSFDSLKTLALASVFAICQCQLSLAQETVSDEDSYVIIDDYNEIQAIQFEVQQLRGQVEELNYQIEQLKKQRIRDYLDLDRRLNALAKRNTNKAIAPAQSYIDNIDATATTTVAKTATNSTASADNFENNLAETIKPSTTIVDTAQQYQQATNLLRNKQVNEALVIFDQIQTNDAESRLAANSLFWMGKIYQIKKKNELARQHYVQFLERFPEHRKAHEVSYFLGKLYFDLNDQQRSQSLMEFALQSANPKVTELAARFLEANYASPNSAAEQSNTSTTSTVEDATTNL